MLGSIKISFYFLGFYFLLTFTNISSADNNSILLFATCLLYVYIHRNVKWQIKYIIERFTYWMPLILVLRLVWFIGIFLVCHLLDSGLLLSFLAVPLDIINNTLTEPNHNSSSWGPNYPSSEPGGSNPQPNPEPDRPDFHFKLIKDKKKDSDNSVDGMPLKREHFHVEDGSTWKKEDSQDTTDPAAYDSGVFDVETSDNSTDFDQAAKKVVPSDRTEGIKGYRQELWKNDPERYKSAHFMVWKYLGYKTVVDSVAKADGQTVYSPAPSEHTHDSGEDGDSDKPAAEYPEIRKRGKYQPINRDLYMP